MQGKPVEPGSPQDWLRNARSDLALSAMRKTKAVLYEHLCFHAQQAAEKALKSVLVLVEIRFPRTHDLAYLMDLLPPQVSIPPALIDLPLLTKFAVLQRYPGDAPPVTVADRRRAVLLAQEAVAWASTVVRCS
jgi:HEPN domain-containing protein